MWAIVKTGHIYLLHKVIIAYLASAYEPSKYQNSCPMTQRNVPEDLNLLPR